MLFILLLHYARGGPDGLRACAGRAAASRRAGASTPRRVAGVEPLPRRTLPAPAQPLLVGAAARSSASAAWSRSTTSASTIRRRRDRRPDRPERRRQVDDVQPADRHAADDAPAGSSSSAATSRRCAQRAVARLGMARTFQHVKLRPQMSLLDNVALGAHGRTRRRAARRPAPRPRRGARGSSPRRCASSSASASPTRAHELAGSLPLGTQRILEIARALAADPVLLVLDEPAAGLRRQEKQALADAAAQLRGEGVTILHRRARHGLRDEAGRPPGGDELRRQARRGRAGRGARRSARAGGVPGGAA
mgnify:CR=1 FL=1